MNALERLLLIQLTSAIFEMDHRLRELHGVSYTTGPSVAKLADTLAKFITTLTVDEFNDIAKLGRQAQR